MDRCAGEISVRHRRRLPIIALLLCRVPKFKGKLQPLSLAAFLLCLIAAMGTGNVFNLLGNLVNAFFSAFNGRTIEEMNPAAEMMMDMTPSMVIYAAFWDRSWRSFCSGA